MQSTGSGLSCLKRMQFSYNVFSDVIVVILHSTSWPEGTLNSSWSVWMIWFLTEMQKLQYDKSNTFSKPFLVIYQQSSLISFISFQAQWTHSDFIGGYIGTIVKLLPYNILANAVSLLLYYSNQNIQKLNMSSHFCVCHTDNDKWHWCYVCENVLKFQTFVFSWTWKLLHFLVYLDFFWLTQQSLILMLVFSHKCKNNNFPHFLYMSKELQLNPILKYFKALSYISMLYSPKTLPSHAGAANTELRMKISGKYGKSRAIYL